MKAEPPGTLKLQDIFLVGMLVIIVAALITTLMIQPPKDAPSTLNVSYISGVLVNYSGENQVTVKIDKFIDYTRFQIIEKSYTGPIVDTIQIPNSTEVYYITVEEKDSNQTRMYYWKATKNQLYATSVIPGLNMVWKPEEYNIEEK